LKTCLAALKVWFTVLHCAVSRLAPSRLALAGLALAGLALAAAPMLAQAQQDETPPVRVALSVGEDGLIARYRFLEPAVRLQLGAPLSEAVDRLILEGEPARIEAGIAHCGPDCRFGEAELTRMAPVVRGYPDYIDAGACGVWADVSAYVPLDTQTGEPLAGAITVGGREIAFTGEHPHYVAVRAPERTPVCDGAGVMAEDRLGASAARMAADYGLIFGPLAPGAPQIVAAPASAALDAGVRGVRGAAAGDDLIFLFSEPGDALQLDAALAVLSHEMAHLWIGRRARLHPQFEQAWITEGAAEYLSLKQLLRTDMATQRFVLDQLSRHISACLSVIGEAQLLLNGSTQEGAFPYNCGTLIAVLADRAAQVAGSSFEAAMADMIVDPAFTSAQASGLDYAAGLGAHMSRADEQVMRQDWLASMPDKRARLLASLSAADLGQESRRGGATPAYLASVAADHVLAQLCPEGGGRFWIDSGVVLELAPACHGPAGTSELTAIAGIDPLAAPQAALDALAASCGPGGPLTLSLGDVPHELSCGAALPVYFRGFSLNEARALETLAAGP
jgi:hypothetical protein